MNRQTDDDAVLHYFNNYGDSYKNYKVNIFDLEEKFQNKAMLKLAEQQSNHPHFRHIWHGEAKIENHNSLFPFSAFKYENINISDITYVAIGVDPAVSDEKTSDETGIIVAGYNSNTKLYYVLEDASGVYTPLEWGRKINNLYHKYKANVIIAERNQGGDLIKRNLMAENTHNTLNIKTVYARKGKHIRAEPISALIDSGKVIHIQKFSILENQLNSFTPSGYTGVGSPDHADAYVYALQYLVDNYGGRKSIDVW
jgi:predicted phage terminase large subunit-like protein